MRLNALFRLAFASAPHPQVLSLAASTNSSDHYAKGTQSHIPPKWHSAPTACKPIGFKFYFTPLTGVLFNFPSRYLFTIGRLGVFSLRKWFSQIPTRFLLARSTWGHQPRSALSFHIQDYHLLWSVFPNCSIKIKQDFFSSEIKVSDH